MKTKEFIITGLMLAMGLILHSVTPAIFFGMKPDLLVVFLVLAVMLTPTIQNTVVAGIGAGILSAMTTSFPGGQIPNVVDKIVTSLCIFLLIKVMVNVKSYFIKSTIIMGIATLVSGATFLSTALVLVGLHGGASFTTLFMSVVLPTFVANVVSGAIVYKAVSIAAKSAIKA